VEEAEPIGSGDQPVHSDPRLAHHSVQFRPAKTSGEVVLAEERPHNLLPAAAKGTSQAAEAWGPAEAPAPGAEARHRPAATAVDVEVEERVAALVSSMLPSDRGPGHREEEAGVARGGRQVGAEGLQGNSAAPPLPFARVGPEVRPR
jgi:hypothetical protein